MSCTFRVWKICIQVTICMGRGQCGTNCVSPLQATQLVMACFGICDRHLGWVQLWLFEFVIWMIFFHASLLC